MRYEAEYMALRTKRAKEGHFPVNMDEAPFKRAHEYITKVGFKGLAYLAVDDTKLHGALRMYFDPSLQQEVLVGAAEGPLTVANAAKLKRLLSGDGIIKASKVRVRVPCKIVYSD
jgi:hypothetical protein